MQQELAGLDRQDIEKMLNSDEFGQEVREDEKEAAKRGVHGVPYFLVAGVFAIPGAVSTEDMKRMLREALAGEKIVEGQGKTCGPDGCLL